MACSARGSANGDPSFRLSTCTRAVAGALDAHDIALNSVIEVLRARGPAPRADSLQGDQPRRTAAKRQAHEELAVTCLRPREHEVAEVREGDKE
jgi:hypothetical protein